MINLGPEISEGSSPIVEDRVAVLFVGNSLNYSTETLNSVEFEFGVAARRVCALDEARLADRGHGSSLSLIVVDERNAEDLLARPLIYRAAASNGCLAFAYRTDAAARAFLRRWDRAAYGDIGFLPLNAPVEVWRSALRLLLHHHLYIPAALMDDAVGSDASEAAHPPTLCVGAVPDAPPRAIYRRLTRREKQVLELVAQGESNKAVAGHLGITEHTVKLHVHNLVNKIGVPNRTAAASFYFEVAGQLPARYR